MKVTETSYCNTSKLGMLVSANSRRIFMTDATGA